MLSLRKTCVFGLFAGLWVIGLGIGFGVLSHYENTPGIKGAVISDWPATSRIPRLTNRATLIMFLHPQCPCSMASIEQFSTLLKTFRGNVDAHVVFFKPRNSADDWAKSDLWNIARKLPNIHIHFDEA